MASNNLALTVLLLVVLQIIVGTVLVQAQNTNFSFPYFTSADQDSFFMVDDVQLYTANSSFLLNSRGSSLSTKSCGRLLYKDRVRMKDSSSGAVASFNTTFTFQITGLNYWVNADGFLHGDGMAFTFTRNSNFTDESTGGSLCLIREENNGMASNRLFAVEFDTFQNAPYNDTSNNHVGVDINSMASTWSYNLCGGTLRNCTYLCNGGYFTAWIDYDSGSQKLQVFLANGSSYNNVPKPTTPIINASLPSLAVPLADLVDDYMYVGFSASTGAMSEVHQIQSWKFATSGMPEAIAVPPPDPLPNPTPKSATGRTVGIIVGVVVGAILALLGLCFCIARYRIRRSPAQQDKFSLVDQNLVPRAFTHRELCKATKNFSKSELLGSGGFGAVYKGTLPSGALVAVKRMRHESKHGEESFQAEAASLSQIRHRNLVQLRGWCQEEEQLFLVYDYMSNGSLDEWLYHRKELATFPLTLRHSVLSGVAAALSYLHEECAQCVLHRDIKSSNVLLNGELNAYLGDFGLARLIDHRKMEKTTMMAGTLGYMAPEMPHTGKATKESDVYSFGVLILEVMCGTRPLDMTVIERGEGVLVDRVWRAHEAGYILRIADSRLGTFPLNSNAHPKSIPFGELDNESHILMHAPDAAAMEDMKLITNLLHLGLLCCNPNPEDRPPTRLVAQLLQSSENMEMSMPPLPVCKPHAHYSKPGFSHLAMIPSTDITSSLSSVVHVQEAGRGSSQSSTAPSSGVSQGEPANLQTSFVASSEIFSGR
ncbi:hypothetical protein M758_5G157700 [Ceratodon purpureus]|nr:hypothetical protein M758_5G157700 [Ceratodon purpureus]